MLVDLLLVHSGQEDAAALIRRVEAACATIPRSLCDILVLLGEKLRQEGRSVPGTELIRRAILLARNTGRTEDAAAWEATLSTRR